jgi:glycerophosphoryl diester phosphodiesterase
LQAAHVAAMREAGLRMMVYTVNSRKRRGVWRVGCERRFSDRPDLLLVTAPDPDLPIPP